VCLFNVVCCKQQCSDKSKGDCTKETTQQNTSCAWQLQQLCGGWFFSSFLSNNRKKIPLLKFCLVLLALAQKAYVRSEKQASPFVIAWGFAKKLAAGLLLLLADESESEKKQNFFSCQRARFTISISGNSNFRYARASCGKATFSHQLPSKI